jgi:hypothetical protein
MVTKNIWIMPIFKAEGKIEKQQSDSHAGSGSSIKWTRSRLSLNPTVQKDSRSSLFIPEDYQAPNAMKAESLVSFPLGPLCPITA